MLAAARAAADQPDRATDPHAVAPAEPAAPAQAAATPAATSKPKPSESKAPAAASAQPPAAAQPPTAAPEQPTAATPAPPAAARASADPPSAQVAAEAATSVHAPLPQRVRGDSGLGAGRVVRPAARSTTSAREADAVTEQFAAVRDAAPPDVAAPDVNELEVAASDVAGGPAAGQQPPWHNAPAQQPAEARPPRSPRVPPRRPPDARPSSARPSSARPDARPSRAARPRGLRLRVVAAAAAVLAIVVLGSVIHALLAQSQASAALSGSTGRRAAVVRDRAAAWLAAQVGRGTRMTCDAVMCAALRARGIPAADLDELRPGGRPALPAAAAGASPVAVLVATPAVRGQLGSPLSSVYAPAVIASFGSGPARIEVRAMAGPGAAAMARSDLVQRRESGAELLHTDRIVVSAPAARNELARGQVDARLLVMIADLASRQPLEVMAFGDRAPGARLADSPLRSVELAPAPAGPRSSGSAFASSALAFLHTQAWPFATASAGPARLPGGQLGVRFAFAAPSPLGLLG